MAPLATEKTLDRGLGGRCQEKTNTGPAAPNSSVVSPYVAPNSTRHAACAERKWGRTGQGRDTRSPSLNVTKLTERESTTWQVRTAVQKAIVFKKKKKEGGAEENIHTCMSEQAENSGDHFEMYKNPEALCVYQQLPALEVKYTWRTNSQKRR